VAVLTNSGEKLQMLSDTQARQTQQGLQNAGQKLAEQNGTPLQTVGERLANGDIVSAAAELASIDLSQLSQAEQQQLADQMNQMAQSLGASNPQISQQLQQAAQALQNGNQAAAQQALQNAAQALAQSGQQVAYSQTAQQAAAQLQQGAGQVMAAGGSPQGNGQQASNGQGQGQAPGQGQANSQGGSGSGQGSGQTAPGGESGASPIPQNAPGNGGEPTYEPIYAPSLLGGEGGPNVNLPGSGDNSGDVIGQGPTTPGDPGTSLVPYNEVYSQYEQVNQQAMQNASIPFQFIFIIQNYFSLISP
jgi:cobalamin biosynthesis Mg chelatase CobN